MFLNLVYRFVTLFSIIFKNIGPLYIYFFHQKHGSDRVEETNKQTNKQPNR